LATQEKQKKSVIGQVLTSACCPRQSEHTDITKVANNHITAISERCLKAKILLLHSATSASSSSHFSFPHDFSVTIADTDIINTPLEPLWSSDMPFGGYKTETKDF